MNDPKPNITAVTAQYLCNTCGACFAACRSGAIRYKESVGGYLFPVVDAAACSHCGICYQVCPGVGLGKTLCERIAQDPFVGDIKSCHVGRATDGEIYRNSQSGGLATALLHHLFACGQIDAAIVTVMEKSTPPRGGVRVVYQAENLKQAQKSKYSPTPLLMALRQLPPEVHRVGLVALPCQMHGLHNLQDLVPAYKNLFFFKIGLICDRTMTSSAIDYMGMLAAREPLTDLIWRDKQKNSYPGNPVVFTESGRQIILKASQRMMIKDFFTPIRCRLCFDKLNIFADVTAGDPHGIKGVDRQGGESIALVRTKSGHQMILEAIRAEAISLREITAMEVIAGQRIDEKRRQWAGYMHAWADMGRTPPRYPFVLPPSSDIAQQKHWLQHGLQLDQFASRADVLQSANQWALRYRLSSAWRWPFARTRSLLRRLAQGKI